MTKPVLLLAVAGLAIGCAPEPRYGEGTLSASAPRLSLTGTTFGQAAAMELAPGCPGYLDAEQPAHVIRVPDATSFTVQVRSPDGPVALAVASADEVRCDSDEGSGHAPTLSFEGPGDYQVFVASLRQPSALAYEVTARAAGAANGAVVVDSTGTDISVTVTSEPPGAQVRDAGGQVLGTTPTMFVTHVTPEELGQPRAWTLSLADHDDVTVTGQLTAGAMVLHGALTANGPTLVDVTAAGPQAIRDYQSAALAVEVAERCPISEISVGVDIQHSFIGDLRVVLRTPWADEITLHRHTGGGRRNLRRTWDGTNRALSAVIGRTTAGRWTLVVHDDAGADQGSFESFELHLGCSAPGSAPVAAVTSPVEEPATPSPGRRPSPNPTPRPNPRLPDLPSRAEIVRVLGGLRPRVESCGAGGGQVRVLATVVGSTGRVNRVDSSGSASPSERSCVERIVRSARFQRFRRDSVDVDHTYDLPARTQASGGPVLDPFAR